MTTQLERIGQKARGERKLRFTTLAHHLTREFLRATWWLMNRRGASGIDGETAREFERDLDRRMPELIVRHKAHKYEASGPSRGDPEAGHCETETSWDPTVEDRLLQRAVARGTPSDLSQGPYQYVAYARWADDMVILVDSYRRHDWLLDAVNWRVREEVAKLGIPVNEQKGRLVYLERDEVFTFLGFDFR